LVGWLSSLWDISSAERRFAVRDRRGATAAAQWRRRRREKRRAAAACKPDRITARLFARSSANYAPVHYPQQDEVLLTVDRLQPDASRCEMLPRMRVTGAMLLC